MLVAEVTATQCYLYRTLDPENTENRHSLCNELSSCQKQEENHVGKVCPVEKLACAWPRSLVGSCVWSNLGHMNLGNMKSLSQPDRFTGNLYVEASNTLSTVS